MATSAYQVERLERRRLLTAVSWDGGGDNTSWSDPLNWSGNAPPTAADEVTIGPGVSNLQITGPGALADSIATSSPITFADLYTLQTNTLTLATGGKLVGGILDTIGTSGVIDVTSSSASGLDAMTVESEWVMSGQLNIFNGLTLNGVMTAGNTANQLSGWLVFFSDDQLFDGTGRLDLGYNFSRITLYNWPNLTRRLEIGAGLTIRTTLGTEWSIAPETIGTASQIVCHARLESAVAGGTLSLGVDGSSSVAESFTTDGAIAISNGGTTSTFGSFSSTGTIEISNGNLFLFGSVDAATVNGVRRTGPGATRLVRELRLADGALNLTAETGSLELRSGSTLRGPGLVNTAGGARLVCNPSLGQPNNLTDVTLNGTLQLGANSTRLRGSVVLAGTMIGGSATLTYDTGATLTAADGARLSNVRLGGALSINADGASLLVDGNLRNATVRLNGTGAKLVADGTQTWTSVTTSLLKPQTALVLKGSAAILTLDAACTVGNGSGAIIEDGSNVQAATLLNQGTIKASAGQKVEFSLPGGVTNTGTVQADAGGTISLTGPFTQTAGSVVVNGGVVTASVPMNVTGGSYVVRTGAYTFDAAAFASTAPLNVTVESTGRLTFPGATTILDSLLIRQTGNVVTSPVGTGVLRVANLSIINSGRLDLNAGILIVDYSTFNPAADIENAVRSGYHAGDWLGTGITSSNAAADNNFAVGVADNALLPAPFGTAQGGPLFAGVDVDLTTVLVKFTHRADINLDGRITPDDSAIFGGNYDEGQPATWATGDLNYDGLFTPDDSAIFGGAYDETLPSV